MRSTSPLDISGKGLLSIDGVLHAIREETVYPSGLTISSEQDAALVTEWKGLEAKIDSKAPDSLDGQMLWGQLVQVLDERE